MRELVTVQKILDIRPIDGADAIEVADVLGWHVVVKKGEFQAGDYAVYFEVDSLLPEDERWDFLSKNGLSITEVNGEIVRGWRLRTIKLRGQISQGLLLPLSILGPESPEDTAIWEEGDDVTDFLGVVKYERVYAVNGVVVKGITPFARGPFPSFIPKTDETRLQSVPWVLEACRDTSVYVTEKLDGSSCTMYVDDDVEFHVCSRSVDWEPESQNVYWKAALAARIPYKLEFFNHLAIQGEIIGAGVQGSKYPGEPTFYAFGAYDWARGVHLGWHALRGFADLIGVPTVPFIQYDILDGTVDEWVQRATFKSLINPGIWAEGIVVRSIAEHEIPKLGRLSFKVINPEFLLREK